MKIFGYADEELPDEAVASAELAEIALVASTQVS